MVRYTNGCGSASFHFELLQSSRKSVWIGHRSSRGQNSQEVNCAQENENILGHGDLEGLVGKIKGD